jgi:phosphoribosyl-ATP pyrophosphohydrolase/phosphoribosyl-AMP cyclohydrolase/histidinol dehydrogenase
MSLLALETNGYRNFPRNFSSEKVVAAKLLVTGKVKIDMLAGPSECLVIADESADPGIISADLLAQAEHDPDARPLLVTVDDRGLAKRVNEELEKQLAVLPTAEIARQALKNGFVVFAKNLEEAARASDKVGKFWENSNVKVAPEHLELHVKEPLALKALVSQYGSLFIGHHSAEVMGNALP